MGKKLLKFGRRLLKTLFVLTMLGTLSLIGLIAYVTWEQYQDTKDWEQITLEEPMKDVPPFLARNYVNAGDKEAILCWQKVSDILTDMEDAKEISEKDRKTYQEILNDAVEKQEQYEITSGTIAWQNEQLQLYLDLETVLSSAYEVPNVEKLTDLTNRLYTMNLVQKAPIQDAYFERLRTVAEDYKNLSVFLSDTLSKFGILEDGTLHVNKDMDTETTDQLVAELNRDELKKFSFIQELGTWLQSSEWTSILRHNKVVKEYETWKAVEETLCEVSKSQYYALDDIKTYKQALDAGLQVDVKEKKGYTIDLDSPVLDITYHGVTIKENQYIRYGTSVIVTIEENYIKIPEPPVIIKATEEETTEQIVVIPSTEETEEITTETETTEVETTEDVTTEQSTTEDLWSEDW